MQPVQFDQAVDAILEHNQRFDPSAYYFLKEALDFTVKRVMEDNGGEPRHVSGPELLAGFRDHALDQFGPLATTLLREWGVQSCSDVGEMVFLLIDAGVFGKQDSDTKEDFADVFDFDDAFVVPFLPKGRRRQLAT
jgi:uncharacterized repeat protein (TIGR04138 family)